MYLSSINPAKEIKKENIKTILKELFWKSIKVVASINITEIERPPIFGTGFLCIFLLFGMSKNLNFWAIMFEQ